MPKKNDFDTGDISEISRFTSITRVGSLPGPLKIAVSLAISMGILIVNVLVFVPWRQTSEGTGVVIAYNPNERMQDITAFTSGIVKKWFIKDGQFVRKGEPLIEVSDTDNKRLQRIYGQLQAVQEQYNQTNNAVETSMRNKNRQKRLWEKGIIARKQYEEVDIKYQKIKAYRSELLSKVKEKETSLARQKAQVIRATRDGHIISKVSTFSYVSPGSVLATFIPDVHEYAVEMFINSIDASLVYPGRDVRLVFEGWPAFQYSGWSNVAIGTFLGVVKSVDVAIYNGKVRIIVVPDESTGAIWPTPRFLRVGTRVRGWVIMNEVSIGYEVWRRMNSFPKMPSYLGEESGGKDFTKSYSKVKSYKPKEKDY